MTHDEQQRIAYVSGDTKTADLLAQIEDLQTEIDRLSDIEDDYRHLVRTTMNHAEYREFFHDCFRRLDDTYSCPEVTSDYDKSVIFDAIERGAE